MPAGPRADLLVIVTHHVGELDAFLPLIHLARQRAPGWRASVLIAKRGVLAQVRAARGFQEALTATETKVGTCLVNAVGDAAAESLPAAWADGRFARSRGGKAVGRLFAWLTVVAALPRLVAAVRSHRMVSVEGTQYVFVPWLVTRLGRWLGRPVFFHNHSVQPILSLPKRLPYTTDPAHAHGIVFSDTDLARSLYGDALREAVYRTGLLKYRPEWIALCRARFRPDGAGALVIFSKRIQFGAYRGLMEQLLAALAASGLRVPVVLKPHPMDGQEVYRALLAAHPDLDLSLSGEPNFALVPRAVAALCFPGSSILDCDAFGVPAIEFRLRDPEFAPGKTAPADYAQSGFPSTDDLAEVIAWVRRHADPAAPVAAVPVARQAHPGAGDELDALLDRLTAPQASRG